MVGCGEGPARQVHSRGIYPSTPVQSTPVQSHAHSSACGNQWGIAGWSHVAVSWQLGRCCASGTSGTRQRRMRRCMRCCATTCMALRRPQHATWHHVNASWHKSHAMRRTALVVIHAQAEDDEASGTPTAHTWTPARGMACKKACCACAYACAAAGLRPARTGL